MEQQGGAESFGVGKMIADYLENGLLDNIVDMFKHDENLYEYAGDLLTDERMRVRIGAIALFEALGKEAPDKVKRALPSVLSLLENQNPVVRGDAAYLLGIIGNRDIIPFLEKITNDEDANVRLIARETIEDIRGALDPMNALQ